MSRKSLVITLVAHQPYVRAQEIDSMSPEIEMLFSAISDTYLPLLSMFERLDMDSVPFRVSMVMTPTLCSLLSDYDVQQRYVAWLDRVIALGQVEVASAPVGTPRHTLAEQCLERYKKNRADFTLLYKSDLLSAFRYYADRGSIELLATAATSAFLPHYVDLPEAVNAQIEGGLHSHRQFFGVMPDGFWLPAMGYTSSLEHTLRSYGFSYTVLDSHGLLFGEPCPSGGIFTPARCENGLVLFARDVSAEAQVAGTLGFMSNNVYRDQNRDLAFEATLEELDGFVAAGGARCASGYKYWARGAGGWYDSLSAMEQVRHDAVSFVDARRDMLNKAEGTLCASELSLVCAFDARLFGQRWYEGVEWLEQVFRAVATCSDITLEHCSALIGDKNTLSSTVPFMSAATGTGYGEDMLDTSNDWMLQYSRKACERMIYLAERFPEDTGLKARALNMAAKEVLLAQSLDWPSMVHDKFFPEYAESQFKKNVLAFTTVYDSLGANSISTEWLTNMEQEHPLFPWMNYRIFSRKK